MTHERIQEQRRRGIYLFLLNRDTVIAEVLLLARRGIALALKIPEQDMTITLQRTDDGGLLPQVNLPKYVDLKYAETKVQPLMGEAQAEFQRCMTGLRARRVLDATQAT